MSAPADLVPFVADSVEDAVTQVRARLGPSAVVVHVRRIPLKGKGWFKRRKQRLEILAYRPPAEGALDATSDAPATPESAPSPLAATEPEAASESRDLTALEPALVSRSSGGGWRIGALLEGSGFLPVHAQRVVDDLRRLHGEDPPGPLSKELELARSVLAQLWRKPAYRAPADRQRAHVLVGAPGVGKTTCLCKWLTQAVLVEGRRGRVWRLDGQTANTAESLSVYCEILGVPMERIWQPDESLAPDEIHFLDLPGTNWRDAAAVRALAHQLEGCSSPQVFLVLNGAYEQSLLLQQVRAFSVLNIESLIVTHLDEETRWGKIWNLVLGTNYSVRFLSAGQNIPGEFLAGSAESLLARQFPA